MTLEIAECRKAMLNGRCASGLRATEFEEIGCGAAAARTSGATQMGTMYTCRARGWGRRDAELEHALRRWGSAICDAVRKQARPAMLNGRCGSGLRAT